MEALNAILACCQPRKDQSNAGPQDENVLESAMSQFSANLSEGKKKLLQEIIVAAVRKLNDDKLPDVVYTDELLEKMGVGITPSTVAKCYNAFWEQKTAGMIISEKLYIYFDDDNHAWTYGVLSGSTEEHCGIKEIHFAPDHPADQPLQKATVLIREKKSGLLYGIRAGEIISKLRTGWSFLPAIDLQPPEAPNSVVALIGAGEIADAVMEFAILRADKISRIHIFCHFGKSNARLAAKFQEKMSGKLFPATDRKLLRTAHITVGATNAGKPALTMAEANPNGTFLSLSIDDMPGELIAHTLKVKGLILLDDPLTHEKRNTSCVGKYFSRQGLSLTKDGDKDVIKDMADVLTDPELWNKWVNYKGPRIVGPVGMAATDVTVGVDDLKRLENVVFN